MDLHDIRNHLLFESLLKYQPTVHKTSKYNMALALMISLEFLSH